MLGHANKYMNIDSYFTHTLKCTGNLVLEALSWVSNTGPSAERHHPPSVCSLNLTNLQLPILLHHSKLTAKAKNILAV